MQNTGNLNKVFTTPAEMRAAEVNLAITERKNLWKRIFKKSLHAFEFLFTSFMFIELGIQGQMEAITLSKREYVGVGGKLEVERV